MAGLFSKDWKTRVRYGNVEQLRRLPIVADEATIYGGAGGGPKTSPEDYAKMIKSWIAAAPDNIKDAHNNQAFTGKTLSNWNNIVLVFLINAATNMRILTKVVEAANAAKAGEDDKAMELLEGADAYIRELANLMGLEYITICDLPDEKPIGHPFLAGPFCGMFWSSDPAHPFIGITFKGTDANNAGEVYVDFARQLVQMEDGVLYNTKVSRGVSTALFGKYTSLTGECAFDYIRDTFMSHPAQTSSPYIVNVSGHSLGASYAMLFYTELLRQISEATPMGYQLGDLCTFGGPRIGGETFPPAINKATSSERGGTWRIVNDGDSVPMIPPAPKYGLIPPDESVYFHIDSGYLISPTAMPEPIPTEIGKPGPPPPDLTMEEILARMKTVHAPPAYWVALAKAAGIPWNPTA